MITSCSRRTSQARSLFTSWVGHRRRPSRNFLLVGRRFDVYARCTLASRFALRFFASRASFSNSSSTASPGAYFRYHRHQPSSFEDDGCGPYHANRNGSIRRESTCTGADGSYKLSGIRWKGQLGVEGSVADLSSAELVVQKLEVPAEYPTFTQYRICGGLETEARIQP